MPAGLDGNPDPIVTPTRTAVIDAVVDIIATAQTPQRPLLVAIDGIDGSGKSTFADELAKAAGEKEICAVRSTIDSFHNKRSIRHARGATSPLGFYADSHNLDALRRELLDPFKAGTGSPYRVGVFDEPTDAAVDAPVATVRPDDVLLFDGIFVQRPELAAYWDLVIFLDAQHRVELDRLALVLDGLPQDPIEAVSHSLVWATRIDRYASGMRYYLDLVDPIASAHVVIDNNAITSPQITKAPRQ